jgi:hypothetical protein
MSEALNTAVVENTTTTPVATEVVTPAVKVDTGIQTAALVATTTPVETASTEVTKTEVVKETVPPAKVVPEKYELKLPDGSPLDQSSISKISDAAKARGLSNEEAQNELNRESASAASYHSMLQAKVIENKAKWVSEVQSDPEIGGSKFDASVANAQRALNKYANPAFVQELNRTGMGDHPELVRTFARIGALLKDDVAVHGQVQDGEKKTSTQIRYDKTK